MRSCEGVKLYSKKLSAILDKMGHQVSHGHCLEIVSRLNDFKDWNTFSARLSKVGTLLPMPKGWTTTGNHVHAYEFGCDPSQKHNGIHPAIIRSIDAQAQDLGFASVMQTCEADSFHGARVRLRADIKALNCAGAVTLWLRADGPVIGKHLSFDNMEERKADGVLMGTTDWQTREIVLDIPTDAVTLNYGFYVRGEGTGFGANFSLEKVSTDTPLTTNTPAPLTKPFNLLLRE